MFTVFIQQPPIHIMPLCLLQHYLYQLNVMYHTNVISNLLHLHSYLIITLCTIALLTLFFTVFHYCLYFYSVFTLYYNIILMHYEVSTTIIFYLTFICIPFSAIILVVYITLHTISRIIYSYAIPQVP